MHVVCNRLKHVSHLVASDSRPNGKKPDGLSLTTWEKILLWTKLSQKITWRVGQKSKQEIINIILFSSFYDPMYFKLFQLKRKHPVLWKKKSCKKESLILHLNAIERKCKKYPVEDVINKMELHTPVARVHVIRTFIESTT